MINEGLGVGIIMYATTIKIFFTSTDLLDVLKL